MTDLKYKNANNILPAELIETIQQYVQGEYIYIPIKDKIEKQSPTEYELECIFSYPEELPIERLDEYNDLVIKYMGARLGNDNIVMDCCHVQEEAAVPHLHLD